jgi:PRC-barrel domain
VDHRRLVYASAADLDRWQCRPLGAIEIEDLKDQPVGHLDGILIDRRENRPMYLVVRRHGTSGQKPQRFLVPVGDAWFDDTERAVRIDAGRHRIPFDSDELERMTPDQADQYERRVLAACCPEIGFHRDGRPDYERLQQFKCPVWLRPEMVDK